jgi:parallel beta-helix repeat protein
VVEGGLLLEIFKNRILQNDTGLVLLHCEGRIEGNTISENKAGGISVVSETTSAIIGNKIKKNKLFGIEIIDPGQPKMEGNLIKDNVY